MNALASLEEGARVGPWTIGKPLGCGLNGEVWAARNVHCRPVALKIPLQLDPDSEVYDRFVREVHANRTLKGRPGLLPFVDAHLPEIPSDDDRP